MNNLTQLALASIYYYDSGLCVVSVLIGVVVDFRWLFEVFKDGLGFLQVLNVEGLLVGHVNEELAIDC